MTGVLFADRKTGLLFFITAELTSPLLCFDNSLVAGPKEIFLADGLYQPAAFHHGARVIVNACEHERAALFVQPFVQTVDSFDTRCIY